MSSTSALSYIIISIALLYSFVMPKWADVSILLDQKSKLNQTIDSIQQIEQKKNELLARFNEISNVDRKRIESLIPDNFNYVKLVSEIDAVGSRYGISIDDVSYKELDDSVGDSIENAGPKKTYNSAILSFTFVSSYENFGKFIDALEKSLRIMDIKSMKITAQPGGLYQYSVEIETYWFSK